VFLEQYGLYSRKRGETPCRNCLDKDAMSVTFDQNCLYFTFLPTLTHVNMRNCQIKLFMRLKYYRICFSTFDAQFGFVAVQ